MQVKQQLKGIKVGAEFEGFGGFAGRTIKLIDRNLNGFAVFEPCGLSDKVFLSLSSDRQLVRS